tara:strand:+ start:78 stop:281 length:204 start_codon:yes stop_codon:yes gene_type:complete
MENNIWKTKSIERTKENKRLKKRIKELKTSRDLWKGKSIANKAQLVGLEISLKKTKSLIEKVLLQTI